MQREASGKNDMMDSERHTQAYAVKIVVIQAWFKLKAKTKAK
jgi:hypothetical protein